MKDNFLIKREVRKEDHILRQPDSDGNFEWSVKPDSDEKLIITFITMSGREVARFDNAEDAISFAAKHMRNYKGEND